MKRIAIAATFGAMLAGGPSSAWALSSEMTSLPHCWPIGAVTNNDGLCPIVFHRSELVADALVETKGGKAVATLKAGTTLWSFMEPPGVGDVGRSIDPDESSVFDVEGKYPICRNIGNGPEIMYIKVDLRSPQLEVRKDDWNNKNNWFPVVRDDKLSTGLGGIDNNKINPCRSIRADTVMVRINSDPNKDTVSDGERVDASADIRDR